MSPNRITKMLQRRIMVSWRDQPTRYDIEALQANVRRVGLVIRVRWALVAALSIFSVLAASAYAIETPFEELWRNMAIPAFALAFVLVYNAFYQSTYRKLGNIALLNHAQLIFDAVVVTVLVYYSGGVHSWFWAMYSLFILEAAFILPSRRDTWSIASFCILAVGLVQWGEYWGWIPHVAMPFISEPLHDSTTFVAVRYLWQITVLAGTATVATLMTASIRSRESELAESSITDDKTGLYDRRYFLRALGSELVRADHDGRPLHVLLIDIDDFGRFNRLLGIEKGDAMLREIAGRVSGEMARRAMAETNIVARFGGEEFAVIYAEHSTAGFPTVEEAEALAEAIRVSIEGVRVEDAGVTVSVGLSSFPQDGSTRDELLDAADEALLLAVGRGGNAVAKAITRS